jgi:O-antigen/teichoic acid export membrane protein
MYRIVRKDLPYRLRIDRKILATFIRISLPLLPVFFFSWIIQSSDTYFLAYFTDEAAVGKYSVVYGLTGVILALTYALNFFWFPMSARLWVEDREKYRRVFRLTFMAFSAGLLVIVLLFELNSRAIMQLLVRKSEYHDAYAIMGIIAFAFALQVLITLLTAPLYANRNVKSILFCYLLGGGTNVGLNFLLIPSTGIVGAAVSTAASYFVVVCCMAILNYRAACFDFLDRRLVYVAAVFLAAWAGMHQLREGLGLLQGLLANIPVIGVAGAAFCSLILSKDERTYLLSMIKGAKAV